MSRRTVITGMGCISPLGHSVAEFTHQLESRLAAEFSVTQDCRVNDYLFADKEVLNKSPRLDISCRYLLGAAKEALGMSGIEPEAIADRSRVGVIVGSTYGLFDSQQKYLEYLYRTKKGFPTFFQQTTNNLLSGIIAYKYQLNGPNMAIFNGWTAGLDAVRLGQQLISAGRVDLVIAGGVDILNETILAHYAKMKYVEEGPLQPSFLPGEGAGIVVLEAEESALKRGAKIYGKPGESGQVQFYDDIDLQTELSSMLKEVAAVDLYLTNENGTALDWCEKAALEVNGVKSTLALKTKMGECGAASGVFQLIYGMLRAKTSLILNISTFGQFSYLKVEGQVE